MVRGGPAEGDLKAAGLRQDRVQHVHRFADGLPGHPGSLFGLPLLQLADAPADVVIRHQRKPPPALVRRPQEAKEGVDKPFRLRARVVVPGDREAAWVYAQQAHPAPLGLKVGKHHQPPPGPKDNGGQRRLLHELLHPGMFRQQSGISAVTNSIRDNTLKVEPGGGSHAVINKGDKPDAIEQRLQGA
ncbi:hypothetical protein CSUB01_12534 [Colletotrichum sublineola]|uniref:Uncharacterized protein n=1 Tax=Colletotrichum sublineola TaxID=1173701 RepID=A0A066XZ48_COLSU|nr:hypothetical protein CSUB01_12534 [Colletotrichum sublineola]